MMGLLIKDFKLLQMQKKFLLILLVLMGIFMTLGYDASFLISYPTFLCSFFVISTIGYDDYNHCSTFLMTLPIQRRTYAIEKYVLSLIVSGSVWLVSTVICTIYQMNTAVYFNLFEWLGECVVLLCVPLFFLILVLPIEFKYGAEKGRIAMIIALGIAFLGGFISLKVLDMTDIHLIAILESLPVYSIVIFAIILVVLLTMISCILSVRIISKKEF